MAATAGTVANGGSGAADIDEDLHSRQLAVYGKESMRRMALANVLVCGLNGLGVEIGERLGAGGHDADDRRKPPFAHASLGPWG